MPAIWRGHGFCIGSFTNVTPASLAGVHGVYVLPEKPMDLKRFRGCALRAATTLALAGLAAGAHANLVSNGGFETGDFTGWTTSNQGAFTGVDTLAPHSGTYGAFFGEFNGSGISQSLATVAGGHYLVEFWLQVEADVAGQPLPNSVSVDWDGNTMIALSDLAAGPYQHYSFFGDASGASTTLSFTLADTPAFLDLDDISVTVPEPGPLALLGIAAMVGGWARRQRRA